MSAAPARAVRGPDFLRAPSDDAFRAGLRDWLAHELSAQAAGRGPAATAGAASDTGGITVRPIRQITGEADFNEVFFNDVAVPATALLGAENDGWRLAMAAANYERSTYFVPRVVRLQVELAQLIRLAARTRRGGRAAIDEPAIHEALTDLCLNAHALRLFADRILADAEAGTASGVDSSAIKLLWSENHQRLLDVAMEVLGPQAMLGPQKISGPNEGRWVREYLLTRAETILAGTSEVHRNIIAERGLGLPR